MKSSTFRLLKYGSYIVFFIISSCTRSLSNCGHPDPLPRPEWIRYPPADDQKYRYFVGVSNEKHSGENDSWNYARISAMNRAIGSVGIQFELDDVLIKTIKNQKTSRVIDPTINWESYQAQKARALIRSVKSKFMHTELINNCVKGTVTRTFYKTFELIKIETSAMKEAEEWQKNNHINQFIRQANQLEAESKYMRAERKLRQARTELAVYSIPSKRSWLNVIDSAVERLNAKAGEVDEEIRGLFKLAKQRRSEGLIIASLELINQAKSKLRNNDLAFTGNKSISLNTLVMEEESIVNNLFLQSDINEVPVVEPSQPIPEFSINVFLKDEKTNVPVKDFPILFTLQTPKSVLTDSEGRARFNPPVIESTGLYQIAATPALERLKGIISSNAAALLKKKRARFELIVKVRTDDERAALLVSELINQLNQDGEKGLKFSVFIGDIHYENRVCGIPQLNRFQKLIRQQIEIQTNYTIHNKVRIPETFPAQLDPFNAYDQARILGINIVSYRFHQIDGHLTFNANVVGPEGLLARSKIWFKDRAINQEIIEEECYVPKLAKWIEPITRMSFRLIKGGCFLMGGNTLENDENEKPAHEVCLKDFYLGANEVTQEQWSKIIGSNPSRWKNGKSYPVERVSWNEAMGFINSLNQKSDVRFDLPTEAEWEFACRGGKEPFTLFGTVSGAINRSEANYGSDYGLGVDSADAYSATAPTGEYLANKHGLYDMSGNVMEWVKDFYFSSAYLLHEKNDPVISSYNTTKVLRGGSYNTGWKWLRCAKRYHRASEKRLVDAGFRLKMIK